ncbi:hypothetical protein LCGC14_1269580 [marine sediment metagenome]|uniref:Uncharacterized protein n=1 Tax=marine sediment metagenome TaxID=412755 RepID=A0A0F9L0C4_9ZZZZ
MNLNEDSWILIGTNKGLYRLKDSVAIKKTLKHYPEMGRQGWLFIANADRETDRHTARYKEALRTDVIFPIDLKAYDSNDKYLPDLIPMFMRVKETEILEKLNYIIPRKINVWELLDI